MERRKDGRYTKDRGRYKGGYCSVSSDKKGMELIIKGDGSVFRPFDKGYRNHLWRMRCGILWTAFYAALSGLRCLVFQPYTAATYG